MLCLEQQHYDIFILLTYALRKRNSTVVQNVNKHTGKERYKDVNFISLTYQTIDEYIVYFIHGFIVSII